MPDKKKQKKKKDKKKKKRQKVFDAIPNMKWKRENPKQSLDPRRSQPM